MLQLGDVHSSVAVAAAVVPVAVSAPKPAPPPPAPPARPVAATTTTVFKAPAAAAAPVAVAEVQNSGRTNTNHGPVYGLDAELKKKMQLQYDPNLEAEAVQWITAVTGKMKPAGEELGAWLHDGTILCELVNTIRPGIIKKINKSSMPFMQMENITAFLRCCRSSLSVPEADLFETVDLYEEKNMNFVIRCLFSLGRSIQTLTPPYTGPALVTHR